MKNIYIFFFLFFCCAFIVNANKCKQTYGIGDFQLAYDTYSSKTITQVPYTSGFNIIDDIQNNAKTNNISFNAKQFKGKPSIVAIVGSYCGYSLAELDSLKNIYNKYPNKFNVIVAVVDPENIDKLKAQYGDQFTYIPVSLISGRNPSGVPDTIYVNSVGNIVFIDEGWYQTIDQTIINFITGKFYTN